MLYYLATEAHTYTMGAHIADWGCDLSVAIQIVTYDELFSAHAYPFGTYILTDLDRLGQSELARLASICSHLEDSGCRMLNHPKRTLQRYDLLRCLHDLGINDFNVYRLSDTPEPSQFPVFLRAEGTHTVASPLLHSRTEVSSAVKNLYKGQQHDHFIVVEYCDAHGPDGRFWKYSAFVVGDTILPWHVVLDDQWEVRTPGIVGETRMRAESDYVRTHPHEVWLREIVQIAGVEYGRIDYGLCGARPQLWEINTNPGVLGRRASYSGQRLALKQAAADAFHRALEAVDVEIPAKRIPTAR